MIEFEPLLRAIYELPLSQFVRGAVWAYPVLETLHLVGLGLLFGPIIIFDLGVLGVIRSPAASPLASLLLPWVWIGFAINATSGVLLFGSDAIEFGANPAFQAKIALIFLAGVNAAIFQVRANRGYAGNPPPAAGQTLPGQRFQAALSILLWLSVIVAGRLVAYVA